MLKRTTRILLLSFFIFILFTGSNILAEEEINGWWFPYIGRFNGEWELSVGAHFWSDHFALRNLQLRSTVDLAPGLRTNMVLRSNKEFDNLKGFDPTFDELYLEGYGYNYGDYGTLSTSLKIGNMRYLRFPYPDLISTFDHVPGTEDLRHPDAETGYKGGMLTVDYETRYGFGYHLTGIDWRFGDRTGSNLIENYLYYRNKFGFFDLEARVGEMQLRHPVGHIKRESPYQLGRSGPGYSVYLGGDWKGYKAGVLYEDLYDEKYDQHDVRTGVMVTFAFSKFTELLGRVRADYTRSPQGFVAHLPLLKGKIGDLKEKAPEGGVLVGEVEAERVITYWQNGQGRNFYEHRISQRGETVGEEMVVVIEKEPWYLKLESLVSPHTSFESWDNLVEWEKHRQGPAQLCQRVKYKFYEKKSDY